MTSPYRQNVKSLNFRLEKQSGPVSMLTPSLLDLGEVGSGAEAGTGSGPQHLPLLSLLSDKSSQCSVRLPTFWFGDPGSELQVAVTQVCTVTELHTP